MAARDRRRGANGGGGGGGGGGGVGALAYTERTVVKPLNSNKYGETGSSELRRRRRGEGQAARGKRWQRWW